MKFLSVLFPLFLIYINYCNARTAFGLLASSNTLIKFDTAAPSQIINSVAISGLAANEVILGIDFRPINGSLYGVSTESKIYIINTITGAAALASTLTNLCSTPAGATYSVDFNPQADRLRIINSATGASYAVNVDDGGCTANTAVNGQPANTQVIQAAYTNNVRLASTTTLFVILSNGQLGQIAAPASGTVTTIGAGLGVTTAGGLAGFDIIGTTTIFASLNVSGVTTLFTIDVATGAATSVGAIGTGAALRSISITFSILQRSLVGLNNDGNFFRLEADEPSSITVAALTGLIAPEFLIGVDFRPSNQLLYGISNESQVYLINPLTYVATPIGAKLSIATPTCVITGAYFGVDWNPQVDLLRVITNSGLNLRINVDTGVCNVDTPISGTPTPRVGGVAYSSNNPGTGATNLYAIDTENDNFGRVDPPNGGVFNIIGTQPSIGTDIGPGLGFDIFTSSAIADNAVAILSSGNVPYFVTLSLTTGAVTVIYATPSYISCRSLSAAFSALPYNPTNVYPDVLLLTNESPQRGLLINSGNPSVTKASVSISGVTAGTTLLGMDLRPADSSIVGLGSNGRLYFVAALTGIAYPLGLLNCSSSVVASDLYSLDFNPQADRLRIVSRAGTNLRVNVDNAACFIDGNLALGGVAPSAAGVAYSNSVAAAPSTAEFILNAPAAGLSSFAQVTNPNGGIVATIGSLGLTITGSAPLDILTVNGVNYGFAVINGVLYDVNLGTGALRSYGSLSLAGSVSIIGMAVLPPNYVPPNPPVTPVTPTPTPNTTTTGATGTTTGTGISTGLPTVTPTPRPTSSAVAVVAPFALVAACLSLFLF